MNYTGDQTYIEDIYIIAVEDSIIGGISGYDNLPFIDLTDTSSYLKKYKGYLMVGSGTPSGSYGISLDSDYLNVIYLDSTTGSFWGRTSSTWVNLTKSVTLNVDNIKLNNSGDETQHGLLDFNSSTQQLVLTNYLGRPLDIKVDVLSCESADATTETQVQVDDNEVIINENITDESENANAQYAVKNYKTVLSTEVRADRYWNWDESRKTWRLIDYQNDLLYLNCSSVLINNIPLVMEWDCVISNQTEFDNVFSKASVGVGPVLEGSTITISESFPYRSIFIRQGNYTWKNNLVIDKNYLTIYSERDTSFTLSSVYDSTTIGEIIIGSYIIGSSISSAVVENFIIVKSTHVNIKLKLNGMGYEVKNFMSIEDGHNNIDIDLTNWYCRLGYGLVTYDNSTGSVNLNNVVNVKDYGCTKSFDVENIQNSFLKGKYNGTIQNTFNMIFNHMKNNTMNLMCGDI